MISPETIDRILQLQQPMTPHTWPVDADDILCIPNGMKLEDVSRFMPPKRIQVKPIFRTPQSFVEYVNRFKTEHSLLTVEIANTTATVTAHLDYHQGDGTPDWRRHTAVFMPEATEEWKAWCEVNGEAMGQMEFANWLEENYELLTLPAGAELLELVQNLEGRQDVRFNSAVRLQTGTQRLHYDEDVKLTGGQTTSKAGEMEIPNVITASIAPFYGVPKTTIRARLKYSIEGRRLSLRIVTIGLTNIVRDCVASMVGNIHTQTALLTLHGEIK